MEKGALPAAYVGLTEFWDDLSRKGEGVDYAREVFPELISRWLSAYEASTTAPDIVEVTVDGFSYLFDIRHERLIAAWGKSHGRVENERDASRMRGHPMSAGEDYHRGHAVAHRLGGGMDINLAPQRALLNTGAFRELERRAIAHPGSLYFTHWIYDTDGAQTPNRVEQGLLEPGRAVDIRCYDN